MRIGLPVPTYGPVTGAITSNLRMVPGSAPAAEPEARTGTRPARATTSVASSHLILLISYPPIASAHTRDTATTAQRLGRARNLAAPRPLSPTGSCPVPLAV